MSYILGLESTCDDSGLAIFDTQNQKILWNKIYSQDDLHKKFGGVVPEIASRGHFQILPILIQQLCKEKEISLSEISAFAVSTSPGLIGSLLVGAHFMESLAWCYNKTILGVDHLEAHILSVLLEKENICFPYLCFLLSGGHTMAVIVEDVGKYQILGKTEDDALGEAFDKIAKILGFEYPGGPTIEKLANLWQDSLFSLPIPLRKRSDYNFSYSGLKTAVKKLAMEHGINREKKELTNFENFIKSYDKQKNIIIKLAASFQKVAFDSLLWNFQKILKKYPIQNFAIVGGVANNHFIVKSFQNICQQKKIQFFTPKKEYCADNGAMIAFCAHLHQKHQLKRVFSIASRSFIF